MRDIFPPVRFLRFDFSGSWKRVDVFWAASSCLRDILAEMKKSVAYFFRYWLMLAVLAGVSTWGLAEVVPVRHSEGTLHGFLELRAKDGKLLAVGELIQTLSGGRVTSRMAFRFKDGSVDEETAIFTQRGSFRLLSDHHVQKGPSFPNPLDISINARTGQVTVRSTGKDGKENTTSERLELPADLANGILCPMIRNIRRETPETKVSAVVAAPKPMLVKFAITPRGEESFSVAESSRKAMHYTLKIELGGAAGLIAPLIGRKPDDIQIWISSGEVPTVLKAEGPLYEGGPVWVIQLAAPAWPH